MLRWGVDVCVYVCVCVCVCGVADGGGLYRLGKFIGFNCQLVHTR